MNVFLLALTLKAYLSTFFGKKKCQYISRERKFLCASDIHAQVHKYFGMSLRINLIIKWEEDPVVLCHFQLSYYYTRISFDLYVQNNCDSIFIK